MAPQETTTVKLTLLPNEGGKLLHVRKRLANGMEATIEAGALDLRFCRPSEAAFVAVASEFELSDEHQDSKSTLPEPQGFCSISTFSLPHLSHFSLEVVGIFRGRNTRNPSVMSISQRSRSSDLW